METVHNCTTEEVNEMKERIKITLQEEKGPFHCGDCDRPYSTTTSLRRHMREVHEKMRLSISCSGCNYSFHSKEDLVKHCNECHSEGGHFNIEIESFEKWDDFKSWLEAKELITNSKLVKRTTKNTTNGVTHYYACQHSGGRSMDDPLEERQRFKKRKRVIAHCPCFVQAELRTDGTVQTKACFTHYGHPINTSMLPLPAEDEKLVKNLVASGVPPQTIVARLRRDKWNIDVSPRKQPRICFLSTRDVSNIAVRSKLIPERSCANDLVSMKNLIANNESIAAVKFFDATDVSGDGFLLALVTKNGKMYLEKYGNRGLVFDDAFIVTRYAFRLATLVVCDDGGNGFPCAHLLLFRMTSSEVAVLFEIVNETVPSVDPQFVMTDDTYVFYNGFAAVFPHSRAAKVLCVFHIKKTIARKHKQLLSGTDVATANAWFSKILVEREMENFEMEYSSYITWLTSIGAAEMYLERNYTPRTREWAACHRLEAPFNTSNHVEPWHNTLKSSLLKRKQNSRLDSLVYTLLQYSTDRHMQLLSASTKGSSNISRRKRATIKRHKEMIKFYKHAENLFKRESTNTWSIQSQSSAAVRHLLTIFDQCDCNAKGWLSSGYILQTRSRFSNICRRSSCSLINEPSGSQPFVLYEEDPDRELSEACDTGLSDRTKEEFHRLEGMVSMIMECGRAMMRGGHYGEMKFMNDNLFLSRTL
ncbi:hypothetical protein V3C99_008523 [Haemonchus contortus]